MANAYAAHNGQPTGMRAMMVGMLAILGGVVYQFGLRSPSPSLDDPRVALQQSTFVGKVLSNTDLPVPIEAWLGIPYAQPPTGPLRFARPKPVWKLKQKVDATEYGYRYVETL